VAKTDPVLVDSNILIDVISDDPRFGPASAQALASLGDSADLIVNPIVMAEVSVGFLRLEDLDEALNPHRLHREDLPWEGAFLAGKAFLAYRRRGGQRRSPLPDFYIGAHAAVARYRLLTRDPERYRAYFPAVELLIPC